MLSVWNYENTALLVSDYYLPYYSDIYIIYWCQNKYIAVQK